MTQDKTPTEAPSDAQLIAELEAAGVAFIAFRGGLGGTKDILTTSGSQDARKIAAGVRAVLAKWGSPVVAGEPREVPKGAITAAVMRDDGGDAPAFCLMVAYRSEKDALDALKLLNDTHPDVRSGYANGWQDGASEAARLLADDLATPQPTQAQAGAVPLSDEGILEMADSADRYANAMEDCGALEGYKQTWSAARDIELARRVEAAHGITKEGGQP
ncbi:hypothetical protein [Acidovorax radicis]|uniref:hypothetical protein n=1 Tax=Acidovorax radicis TaxID=758826 RepID=UPI001CFAB5E8|nr:hypothetical protein [Acidovorax radicis]UCV00250.1 hypothetical protein KI609_05550 [Acidovorax radicis]